MRETAESEQGASIIEYVLLAAVIALGVLAVFTNLRDALRTKINEIITGINGS